MLEESMKEKKKKISTTNSDGVLVSFIQTPMMTQREKEKESVLIHL